MDSPKPEKPAKSTQNKPKTKSSPDKAREAARRAEAKFVGKVANPKLKATGKATLRAAQSDHMGYNNSSSGYNTGPRLGSTREQPTNASEDNGFVIRH